MEGVWKEMEMCKKKLPIGIENFEDIRKEDFYYVDKTGLIADLLHNWGSVNLFTRPRRFGKSLNMSMLEHFFSLNGDKSIFNGLEISKETVLCKEYMGKYPVLSISLKEISSLSYEAAFQMAVQILKRVPAKVQYLLESDEVKEMFKAAEDKGIKILNMDFIFGFRSMMTNKVINTPEDMKGLKIRTPGSQLYVDTLNHMGATATPLAFSETISAVQQGVVDGLEGTIDAYATNGSAEVAKNMALTKHLLGVCGAYISVDVWNKIPAEYQEIIQEEFNKGAEQMVKNISEGEAATREKLEKEMGITFNEVDSEAFAKTVEPIYANMKNVTPGRYEKFKEIIAGMPQ